MPRFDFLSRDPMTGYAAVALTVAVLVVVAPFALLALALALALWLLILLAVSARELWRARRGWAWRVTVGVASLIAFAGFIVMSGFAYAQASSATVATSTVDPDALARLYAYACANEATLLPWLEWLVGIVGGSKVGAFVLRAVDRYIVAVPAPLMQVFDTFAINWVTSTLKKGPPPVPVAVAQKAAAIAFVGGSHSAPQEDLDHPEVQKAARNAVAVASEP